jgi:hyperosmotically inducible protein
MKTKSAVLIAIAGALLLPIAGYAADAEPPTTTKQFVKDSVITTKIKTQLAASLPSTVVHIQVDTDDKGAVTLTGTSQTQAAADKAVAIAKAVQGVTSVDNQIKIYPYK